MDNQWFYIQQWKQAAWHALLEHRTVRVHWDTSWDEKESLPQFVNLPTYVDLTNEGICKYLSNEFGYNVRDWSVARRGQYAARI